MLTKLNIGASPIWKQDGWYILDHKIKENSNFNISGDALNINLEDESCDILFCSHVFEHIPHSELPLIIAEFNRVLKPNGVLRILTPDLQKIAKAYVEKDREFFNEALEEDENLRTDLGFGGMFINCVVSPGQDTALFDRGLTRFIAGYAHVYSYDYEMLDTIFSQLGFENRKASFNDSEIEEMRIPMHVSHLDKKWRNLNKNFFKKNNLIHRLVDGKYEINFTVSGFDRDPLTSLIIESKKVANTSKEKANEIFNKSLKNYNRYSRSLLNDSEFTNKLDRFGINY